MFATHCHRLCRILILLFIALPMCALGEETDPLTSPELERLKLERAILDEKSAIATAKKNIAEAKLAEEKAESPTGESKGLEGNIEADAKFGHFAKILAYHSIRDAASKIAEEINGNQSLGGNPKLLVLDSTDFLGGEVALLQLKAQLKWYDETIASQLARFGQLGAARGRDAAAFAAVAGTLGALADISNFFKTDYKITGQDIQIDELSLAAALIKPLKHQAYLPDLRALTSSEFLNDFANTTNALSKLKFSIFTAKAEVRDPAANKITEIGRDVDAKKAVLNPLKPAENNALIQKLKEEIMQLERQKDILSTRKARADEYIEQAEAIIADFAAFKSAITKPGDGDAKSILQTAVLRESIDAVGITHLLYLKVATAGGEAVTVKRVFSSGHLAFLAGTVTTYVLTDKDGLVVGSNTIPMKSKMHFGLSRNAEDEDAPDWHSID